jgi:hypothetical protein
MEGGGGREQRQGSLRSPPTCRDFVDLSGGCNGEGRGREEDGRGAKGWSAEEER